MIPAFTIVELLIAMIITAVLFVLAGSFMLHLQQDFMIAQKAKNRQLEIATFQTVFLKDVNSADRIIKDDPLNVISENGIISYYFSKKNIIRKSENLTDTFQVECSGEKYYLLNNTVDLGVVDRIELMILKNQKNYKCNFNKYYSTAQYLELKSSNE